jgi:uncharacterized surface protein with fasciclin (FAS1) repeats
MQDRYKFTNLLKLSLVGVVGAIALINLPGKAQSDRNTSIQAQPTTETVVPLAGGAPRNSNRSSEAQPTSETPATPRQTETPVEAPSPEAAPAPDGATEPTGGDNIVALASASDSFKTLTTALQAAELTATLSGEGPFTVFAPTDAAFAALPPGTLQELLKPENKATLVKVLTYHVVPGKVLSSQLRAGQVKTVEGSSVNVRIDAAQRKVMVNNANVTQADIQASNGVIHAIDKVILPPNLPPRRR